MGKFQKDVLEKILIGEDEPTTPEIEELNCLIYRDSADMETACSDDADTGRVVEVSSQNATLKIWPSKARIRVKVRPDVRPRVSINRLATIAMNAILEELNKEAQ